MRTPPAAILSALLAAAPLASQDLHVQGARVLFEDGDRWRDVGDAVVVAAGRFVAIGPDVEVPAGATRLDLDGMFVVPGLIDLHTHLTLHPYDETSWDDQVLRESLESRTIRATVHARRTLEAGFTTIRELGTEGAGFADVALRDAIAAGLVPGPRILAATRALVATGCYGPSGFDPRFDVPKGAQVADGVDGVRVAVREQIAAGADWIKVYADYRRRPGDRSTPTFSQAELDAIVDEARSAGLPVVAHAVTAAAILRAVRAGVKTIEHGYEADDVALAAMREHGVVLCPTLAANEAIVRYRGASPEVARRLNVARATFLRARKAGVAIACGSDAGVFAHGDNAREIELMAAYGMTPADALRAATADAARVLGMDAEIGRIAPQLRADFVVLRADPLLDLAALREVVMVVKDGRVVLDRRAR